MRELLQRINDLTYELEDLKSELWEEYDRKEIENLMGLGLDDWAENIFYDINDDVVVFKNAHTEVYRNLEINFDDLPKKES